MSNKKEQEEIGRYKEGVIMKKWEENIRKVVPYTPGEQPQRKDIIKINTNENPFGPSPEVRKVLQEFRIQM